MKKLILLFTIVLLSNSNTAFAHYLWLETSAKGNLNESQEVQVFFGEYAYGVVEEAQGEAFKGVRDFKLWLVDPSGKKHLLKTTAKADHYSAEFTPKVDGVYLVYLENQNIDVLDYTQYDFGIFKPVYKTFKQVNVNSEESVNPALFTEGLVIKELQNDSNEVKLQVLYNGSPLNKAEATVSMLDLWTKKITTDENGIISYAKPFNTKYIVEVTHNEKTPGAFKGVDYEFIWHCATYTSLP
ncbi:DUF4198 domain-containing protein [Leeuwenhoekiella sp. MAR_2009_132]|uniref:DUF4198 domain-containing protein n=1 Tax=Leeuwenhoekiella sp. MAR_2009_132 TaxID=1392489 RepID=UPI00048B54FE|nr:DUF4198 domain-containing protein [Leeuwenhoekiella sp. MAR_2009_132]